MDKIILEKLIYKNYLKTALTSILFIEIILIIIYFNVNNSIVKKSTDFILKDIKKSVYSSVHQSTSETEHKFDDIETLAKILQNEHQNFFQYQNSIEIKDIPKFKKASNEMYYKSVDNGGSSVVVSKNTIIDESLKNKLIQTEVFDKTFKTIVDSNPLAIAAYFNSYDDVNRYYPFIPNSPSAFPLDIKMENYNFYYEADLKHNPKKEVVWTDVYLDPAGQGWMLSAIVPIYNNGFLEGVTGIDVTVESIINKFLNFKLPYKGSSFLIDKDGKVVAITKEVERMLNLMPSSSHKYKNGETITETVYKKNEYNILDYIDKNIVNTLQKILKDMPYSHDLTINGNKFLIFTEKIERTSWYIISLIDENEITSEVSSLEKYYKNLGYVMILFIIFFYFLFFIYLYSKAKDFVKTINKPLSNIIEMTKNLGLKKDIKKLDDCGIVEIDLLSKNFNKLAEELDKRTKKLVRTETKRAFSEKLANTDALTGVYNRRFLKDFSNKYMKIVKREHTDLSMMLIDIDNFKIKNDTFGHKVGDTVIKKLISSIKDIVRDTDLIVRYGGDEFIVLLPNTNIKNTRKVAQKLLLHINEINLLASKELFFTITVGVAEYEIKDLSVDEIIARADIALYKAKENGKNCVI